MKNKVEAYINHLFKNMHETRKLIELKEEITYNLLEKIQDLISNGYDKKTAFDEAVSSLGNMDELIEHCKEKTNSPTTIDKKHVKGYVMASSILLVGLMATTLVYLMMNNALITGGAAIIVITISTSLFVYYGVTQETTDYYGMSKKRAIRYSVSTAVIILGFFAPILLYCTDILVPIITIVAIMCFCIPSAISFIYLGLTEKCRRKGLKEELVTKKEWIAYQNDLRAKNVRDTLSGAVWIFTIALFLVGIFVGCWFSWIIFIVGAGFQVLIEAYYQKKKTNS